MLDPLRADALARSSIGLLLALSLGCTGSEPTPIDQTTPAADAAPGIEAVSLLGEALRAPELPAEARGEREEKLAAARAEYERDPQSSEAIIWLGRRLAYLGRYREAIEVFAKGMRTHPGDARLYRHRGHRYITTRQLERAVTDLERAAELIAGGEDRVEPDGLPNARNLPTSTLHTNVWYHLGLARYLQGDFEAALAAYRECLAAAANPDMLVATSHWLYMTLRRLGHEVEAAEVLAPIRAELEVIENHDYHRLLLLYRGELPVEELWPGAADDLSSATVGYGVGNWHFYNGRAEEAEAVFRAVLAGAQWAAFGYVAAEAEMARR